MKVKLSNDFYDGERKYPARDEGGQPILYDFADNAKLPSSAEIFDEVPVVPVKLSKRQPDTFKELAEIAVPST